MKLSEQTLKDIDKAFKALEALDKIQEEMEVIKADEMYKCVPDYRWGGEYRK